MKFHNLNLFLGSKTIYHYVISFEEFEAKIKIEYNFHNHFYFSFIIFIHFHQNTYK